MRFTVIANCQAGAIANLLLAIIPNSEYLKVKPIHLLKSNDETLFNKILSDVDVIIHQPISDGFKEFSTSAFKDRFFNKKFVSFPSLFFTGYSPWLMYLRMPAGGTLKGALGDYHDERVIKAFIGGLSVDDALAQMDEEPLSANYIDVEFNKLEQREAKLDVCSGEYIKRNFQHRKLFYVFNHPANEMMIHIASKIAALIGFNSNEESFSRLFSRSEYLAALISPIENVARHRFDIKAECDGYYQSNENHKNERWNRCEYIQKSFDLYKTVHNIPLIFDYALERRIAIGY